MMRRVLSGALRPSLRAGGPRLPFRSAHVDRRPAVGPLDPPPPARVWDGGRGRHWQGGRGMGRGPSPTSPASIPPSSTCFQSLSPTLVLGQRHISGLRALFVLSGIHWVWATPSSPPGNPSPYH